MNAYIKENYIYFDEISEYELLILRKLLTWDGGKEKDEDGKEVKLYETLLIEEGSCIKTYWGLYENIQKVFPDLTISNLPNINVERISISDNILPGITLYEYQRAAAEKGLMLKRGIIEIPTSGGKTEIILAQLKYLIENNLLRRALIVLPSVFLCLQFYLRAILREFDPNDIGIIHGWQRDSDRKIIFGCVNSINNGLKNNYEDILLILREANYVAFDEAHHLGAHTFNRIAMNSMGADYLLGYSGSPFEDPDDPLSNSGDALILGTVGKPIYRLTYKFLIDNGYISRPYIYFVPSPGGTSSFGYNYKSVYNKHIINNDWRNKTIVEYNTFFNKLGFTTLILVQRHDHAMILMDLIKSEKCVIVFGGGTTYQMVGGKVIEVQMDYDKFRYNIKEKVWESIVASPVFDEGIDIPEIDVLILAGAGRSRRKTMQRIGRVLRKKKYNINQAYIIDFADSSHVFMKGQYQFRQKLYNYLQLDVIDDRDTFFNLVINHSRERSRRDLEK